MRRLLALLLFVGACSSDSLEPTVVLISIDGFRPDYVDWYAPPTLSRMAEEGVLAPRGMTSAFPTKTFPNHYTVATGLYPARHGIVANTMYDPDLDAVFRIGDRDAVEDPRWWGGEPIWVTAENQGQTAATFFWVGSEGPVAGVSPTYWKRYDSAIPGEERVDEALSWLDLPRTERPTFVSLYFEDVDNAGHRYGPRSDEARDAVLRVDGYLARFYEGLKARGLDDEVNVIVLSDHGMTETSPDRIVVLEDYVDPARVLYTELREFILLRAADGYEEEVQDGLARMPHVTWLDDDTRESQYRYSGNPRIPDIVGVMDEGWVVIRDASLLKDRPGYGSGGSHGYAPELSSMHALFVARGPAFRAGTTIDPFANVDVYPLLCDLLGLDPAPNDGDGSTFDAVRR